MATPLRIGLTGGIASGKSAVAAAFGELGAPVIDTDLLAREVVEPGQSALAAVVAAFGPSVLGADGRLDRRGLRTLVFADPERRRTLEAILHPAIRELTQARIEATNAPYVIIAIPLLAEGGRQGRVDRVLVVDCPLELQRQRLLARDGETAAGADAILAAQASRAQRLAIADEVIDNTGTLEALGPAVAALHRRYLSLAAAAARPTL
ncbi:MAG: dephospho-CoA kinase [Pseudomonadota bacterium]